MNEVVIINIKEEHLEQIVRMIVKFGVPLVPTITEAWRSLKSIWMMVKSKAK